MLLKLHIAHFDGAESRLVVSGSFNCVEQGSFESLSFEFIWPGFNKGPEVWLDIYITAVGIRECRNKSEELRDLALRFLPGWLPFMTVPAHCR